MKVLVIEDERKVADFICHGLREAGFTVDVEYEGGAGETRALQSPYDVILLDIMLPGRDGFQILQNIREQGVGARIILLTALGRSEDKIKGLNLGGDDYLTKPFDFEELIARINALLRRGKYEEHDILTAGDLVLDRTSQRITRAGQDVELTKREYTLLEYLLLHKDEVVTRIMIAQNVWNLGFETGTNVIDVYINYLRRKIDRDFDQKLISTIRSRGYMITDAP